MVRPSRRLLRAKPVKRLIVAGCRVHRTFRRWPAAKRFTPYTSLGTLVVAVQLLDLLWPTFLMLGIERVRIDPGNTRVTPLAFDYYPWTHSLAMAVVWAGLARSRICDAPAAQPRRLDRRGGRAVALGARFRDPPARPAAVAARRPARGPRPVEFAGGTVAAGDASVSTGVWLYATHTEATDRLGRYALVAFAVTLPLIYAANLIGPLPPTTGAIAIAAQAQWLLVLWAMWIDRHRVAIRQWR